MTRRRSLLTTRAALPLVGLTAALSLVACGQDTDVVAGSRATSTPGAEQPAQQPEEQPADAPTPGEEAPPEPAPVASPVPRTTGGPLVPKVDKGTDLKVKPVPAAAGGSAARPTQLVVQDLVVGTGKEAALTDTVNVQYIGTLYRTGEEFDSSWSRGGEAATFPLGRVVPGFANGIVGMKEGGRRTIVIPSALGYGEAGGGPIPPDSDLVFVVDLVQIEG